MKTTVVNLRRDRYHVFIGRGSVWGNPFHIGQDGTRAEVIEKYREWLMNQPKLLEQIPSLRGRTLGCYCKPLACHGDVLAELADASSRTDNCTEELSP